MPTGGKRDCFMENFTIINFDVYKNATAIKKEARLVVFELLKDFFTEKLGEENVSITGTNELAVHIGDKTLSDGSIAEVCATIKPTVKDYEERRTDKNFFPAFERYKKEDEYNEEMKAKAAKKKESDEKKKAKISRDKKARQEEMEKKKQALNESAEKVAEKQKEDEQNARYYLMFGNNEQNATKYVESGNTEFPYNEAVDIKKYLLEDNDYVSIFKVQ